MSTNVDKKVTALELAQPYAALALDIAKGMKQVKSLTDKLATSKGGVWGGFKQAISIGMAASHSLANIKAGLAVACEEAKIPSGSYRGYIGTIGHLYTDILAGNMTIAEAEALSVADARKRYRVVKSEPAATGETGEGVGSEETETAGANVSEENELLATIVARIKDWDSVSLALLLETLDDVEGNEVVEDVRQAA